MAEGVFESLARGVPELEVSVEIDVRLVLTIRDRQSAADTDRLQAAAQFQGGLFHGRADLGKVLQVGARADVHVQAGDAQAVVVGVDQTGRQLFVPDAVFGMIAAGIRLAAVAMAEAGVDP